MEITGSDAISTTNKRQHEIWFTVWNPETSRGLLFNSEEKARAYAFECIKPAAIVPPLYL